MKNLGRVEVNAPFLVSITELDKVPISPVLLKYISYVNSIILEVADQLEEDGK